MGGLDADSLEIVPLRSVDPLRPVAHVRANGVEDGAGPVAVRLPGRRTGDRHQPAVGRGRWHRTLGDRHRPEYAKIPRAVRPPDRAVPGDQAQVRRDDRDHPRRATAAVCGTPSAPVTKRPNRIGITQPPTASSPPRSPRRWRQPRPALHAGLHPGARRYRLHLGSTAPTSTTGTPSAWSPPSGARDYPQRVFDTATATRDAATGHRPRPRHRGCAGDPCRSRCAQGDSARRAQGRHRRGRLGAPHLPRPWGREARRWSRSSSPRSSAAAGSSGPAWASPRGSSRRSSPSAPRQKQRFLPPTFRGEMILGASCFPEPGRVPDLAGLTTKATKVDGGWRITGQKIWTTANNSSPSGVRCWRGPIPDAPETQRASPASCST